MYSSNDDARLTGATQFVGGKAPGSRDSPDGGVWRS